MRTVRHLLLLYLFPHTIYHKRNIKHC